MTKYNIVGPDNGSVEQAFVTSYSKGKDVVFFTMKEGTTYDLTDTEVSMLPKNADGTVGSAFQQTTPLTVTASPAGGTYVGEQLITLSTESPATIYYTVDGTTPTNTSTIYSTPIAVQLADVDLDTGMTTTTLKFFAVDGSGNAGSVVTQVYAIKKFI